MRWFRYTVLLAFLASLVVDANGTQLNNASFSPLEQWKVAVANGDKAALAPFYATAPPAEIWVARNKIKTSETLNDELEFWASLASSGVTNLTVKVLSLETARNQTKVTLRIECVKANQPVFFRMFQVWVEEVDRWRLASSLRTDFFPDTKIRLPEPTKPNPFLYPDPSQAPAQLTAALAAAGRQNKRVLAVFGANWCYDCHVLEATFNSPEFIPLVEANYIVVHINIGDEGKDNNDLAARLKVNLDRGVPSLAVLNPEGEVVVSQQNGEFQSTEKIGPEDVHAFLEKWKPARN
jgi:thioredoxin 1